MPYPTTPVRAPDAPKQANPLTVTSSSYRDGGTIPMEQVYGACGGKNVSPQLSWDGFPSGTRGFAIAMFDPDAPTGAGYWHWVLANVPGSVTQLDAGAGTTTSPGGGVNGYTDFGESSYCGPCPPKGDGQHRYIITVYALDVPRIEGAGPGTTGSTLLFMMRGHVLAQGSISGRFGH